MFKALGFFSWATSSFLGIVELNKCQATEMAPMSRPEGTIENGPVNLTYWTGSRFHQEIGLLS